MPTHAQQMQTKKQIEYGTNAKSSITSSEQTTNLFQIFNKIYNDNHFIEALSNVNLLLICYPKESKLEL